MGHAAFYLKIGRAWRVALRASENSRGGRVSYYGSNTAR